MPRRKSTTTAPLFVPWREDSSEAGVGGDHDFSDQTLDAEASGLEHDNGAVVEILGTGSEVGEEQGGLLFGASLGAATEEHEGRLSFLA